MSSDSRRLWDSLRGINSLFPGHMMKKVLQSGPSSRKKVKVVIIDV